MDTFSSIIRSKKLWLRNLLAMNDPSELVLHRINIVEEVYKYYRKEPFDFVYGGSENEEALEAYLFPEYTLFNLGMKQTYNNLFFAICMSSEEDSLSQWRMYADNGRGVCIGFDKRKILEYIKDKADYQLQQIEYYQDINDVICQIASDVLTRIKELYVNNSKEELERFRKNITCYCMPEWSKYKIDNYSEENETRLVCRKSTKTIPANANATDIESLFLSDIQWSIRNGELDLHTEVDLLDLGLSTITLGPINNTSKDLLNIILAKEGISIPNTKISKSTIPFR